MDTFRYTGRQWVDVAAVLAGSLLARAQGARWAGPLAGSAATVLAVLSVLLALRVQERHDRVVDVILDGRERVPIALVQRQRRRLLSAPTRSQLARSLDEVVSEAAKPPRLAVRVLPPLCAPPVVSPLADELRDIGALLGADGVSARGVVRVERLLSQPATSPLYGGDVSALREELRLVRGLLMERDQ